MTEPSNLEGTRTPEELAENFRELDRVAPTPADKFKLMISAMKTDLPATPSAQLFATLDPENSEDLDAPAKDQPAPCHECVQGYVQETGFDRCEKCNPATGVEARVCADIAARQRVGIAKYGCTVEKSPDDMLRHAYEEALDLAVYLKAEIERRQTLLDQGLQDNRPPA
jgi:hypothetical protein